MLSINYDALFERNTDAIMVVNDEGFVVDVNPTFYQFSQFSREEVLHKNYESFLQYEQEDETLDTYDLRMRFVCKDKKSVPILARKVMGDGYFFVILKDMHKLDQIAEKYLETELHYRIIAEHIEDVLILMDEHKNYLYVSPSALQMYHFDYKNSTNYSAFFNIHPDDVEQLETMYDKAMEQKMSFTVKVRAWHAQHQWLWTELKGQSMFENGKFKHMLFVARDISSQHDYEEQLLQHAYSDALTNLPNRRRINEWLEDAKTIWQQPTNFAVMLMDVDNFKQINDYYGHEIGDHVLVEYGKRVSQVVASKGIVGRYGGDEFMVILPYDNQQEIQEIAEHIIIEIQQPIEIQQTALTITTSIGVALVEDDTAIRKMLKCADDALYKVKEQGKNNFFIAGVKSA